MNDDDHFDITKYFATPEQVREHQERQRERPIGVPRKIQKRRQHFIMVPMTWRERLAGASGNTVLVALDLLYLSWKGARGQPVKLANGMLLYDGISRHSKWRALGDLEWRGLIIVERRPSRSPLIRLLQI